MIKEKFGNCYEASYKLFKRLLEVKAKKEVQTNDIEPTIEETYQQFHLNENVYLVQGKLYSSQSRSNKIYHSWVETENYAFDFSSNLEIAKDKNEYRNERSAELIVAYNESGVS